MEYQVIFVFLLALFGSVKAQFGDQTIMNILQNTTGLQTFASWCRGIEYQYTLRDPITVFAYNDSAFNTLPSVEQQVLQELDVFGRIKYVRSFTVQNNYSIADLYDGQELTSVQGRRLFVNKKTIKSSSLAGTSRTFINGGMIIREELQASNGVIHVLDKPVSPVSKSNVFEVLSDPDHSGIKEIGNTVKLKELMQRIYTDYFASAIAPLNSEDKVTFFLPSQNVFDRITENELNTLSGLRLALIFKMHFIPKYAVYTSMVDNTASFTSGRSRSQIIFRKIEDRVFVSSGGVTAQIVRGNITVDNGVIHIIDRMLGFVYNTGIEQIDQDAREFSNLIQGVSLETLRLITRPTGLSMFVPRDEAFALVRNLPGINIDGNQTLKEMLVRLSMVNGEVVEVSQMGEVNYESRQRRVSYWNNTTIVIYNDGTDTWVNSGNVRAKIIRPDVGVTNGMLQYVDRLLGIPTMDIPTLIYYDDHLLRTYYEMQRVHLDQYLADPRFDASVLPPRHIDPNAWNDNYGQYPRNQRGYPSNRYNNGGCNHTCGEGAGGCQFTFFVPNGSAIESFYKRAHYAQIVFNDTCRFRFILRRLIIPNFVISLENLSVAPAGLKFQADTGEDITIRKETENDVRILWKGQSARAIMWDLGATNGIVHIVDQILSDSDDEHIDISGSS